MPSNSITNQNTTLNTPIEDKHRLQALASLLPLNDPAQMHDALFAIVQHCDAMAQRWCPEYHTERVPVRRLPGDVRTMIADFQRDLDSMFNEFHMKIRRSRES